METHMKRDGVSEIEQLTETLFLHHEGEREAVPDRAMPLKNRISRRLGRACLLKYQGHNSKARHAAKAARREYKRFKGQNSSIQDRFLAELAVSQYGDFVLHDSNLEALQRNRKEQYKLKISRLEHGRQAYEAESASVERRNWAGFINEMTVLALFNRQQRPDVAALPALVHHENGAVSEENYDILLLAPDNTGEPNSHKLQVKSSEYYAQKASEKYGDDIFILCAERRLGYKFDFAKGAQIFPVADALIAEHTGTATPEATIMLDQLTESLLSEIADHSESSSLHHNTLAG